VKQRHAISAITVAAAAATILAGCGGDGYKAPATKTGSVAAKPASSASAKGVRITDFQFAPTTLAAKSGTQVAVTNAGATAHTVTSDDGSSFDTGPIDPGSSQKLPAAKPGTYAYHCSIHPFMKAKLVVK
jgi:plastocyanin